MKSRHNPDTLQDVMTAKSGKLAKIQQKAGQLQVINQFLTTQLIPGCEEYCRVANLRQGILVIEVASGVWKTRLLQLSQSILSHMQEHISPSLHTVELIVNPQLFNERPEEPKPNPRKISADTAQHLVALAEHAPPELAATLSRLAKLANRDK
tara:strand:+ start:910 stop:1368 length:459 start_codon:yes stop_codon:yes gene_type:complete